MQIFQNVGDWVYLGMPDKIKPEDMAVTPDQGDVMPGPVIDDWFYQVDRSYAGKSQLHQLSVSGSEERRRGSLTGLSIRDGVIHIGEGAFSRCGA